MLSNLLMTSMVGGDRDEKENLMDAPKPSWEEMLDTRQLEDTRFGDLSSLLNITQLHSLFPLECLPHFLACSFFLPLLPYDFSLPWLLWSLYNVSVPKSHCHLSSVLSNLRCRELHWPNSAPSAPGTTVGGSPLWDSSHSRWVPW